MWVAPFGEETATRILERNESVNHSEDEIEAAIKAERLIRQKLLKIMDLQRDIDALPRDNQPSPFGSAKWKNARPEELQRLVMMTAIQFVFFEPKDWVQGNEEFHVAGGRLMELTASQLAWLRKEYHRG